MLRSQLLTLPWRFLKPSLKSMLVNESQLWKYFHIHCELLSYTLFSPSQKSPKRKIQRPNSQFSSGLVNHTHTQCMVSGSACNCPLYFCIYPPTCNHLWGGNKANAEVPNTQVTKLGLSTVFVFLTNNMAQCIQEVNIGIFFLLLPDTNYQIFVSLRFQN